MRDLPDVLSRHPLVRRFPLYELTGADQLVEVAELLLSQRCNRFDPGRASGGSKAGDQCHPEKCRRK